MVHRGGTRLRRSGRLVRHGSPAGENALELSDNELLLEPLALIEFT
jgi:hypothetical protein